MALKPTDLWNQLPSAAELLDKPPIRALAERWNRSVVAGRVRSFLDEMQHELKRRTDDVSLPSLRELAERAARYVMAQQHATLGGAINASGRLCGEPWAGCPLSDAALQQMVAVGREFMTSRTTTEPVTSDEVNQLLCRLTGADAALVVHSYSSALWLVLSALASGHKVLVARAEVGDIDLGQPLPPLMAAAGVQLGEIGTINHATTADYESSITPGVVAILKVSTDDYRVVGQTLKAEWNELLETNRHHQLLSIDAMGAAPLTNLTEMDLGPLCPVQQSISAGVDVVLVRGDGLVGGPACGIVLGKCGLIRRLASQPVFAALRLDAPRTAALLATLETYETKTPAGIELPIWTMLSVSVENLRNRAERIAPQLACAEGITSAVPIETRSRLLASMDDRPSYGVALTVVDDDITLLDKRLRSAPISVIGRSEGNRLVLDLRTVLPRQDLMLVDALLGPTAMVDYLQTEQSPAN